MSVNRLLAASVVVAAVVAVPGAALASRSVSPASKPAAAWSTSAPATKSVVPTDLSALASSAGISVSRLGAGLVAAKQGGGNSTAGIAAFAASTVVPSATAERTVYAVFGTRVDRSLTGPSAAAALATRLSVSTTAAQHALEQIGALSGKHGVDPASPAFATVAHALGLSATQLAAALDGVKQSVAGR